MLSWMMSRSVLLSLLLKLLMRLLACCTLELMGLRLVGLDSPMVAFKLYASYWWVLGWLILSLLSLPLSWLVWTVSYKVLSFLLKKPARFLCRKSLSNRLGMRVFSSKSLEMLELALPLLCDETILFSLIRSLWELDKWLVSLIVLLSVLCEPLPSDLSEISFMFYSVFLMLASLNWDTFLS